MPYVDLPAGPAWHEVKGDGPPLVFLHSGVFGAESWAAQVPAFVSAGFAVHTPERRGHGHTPDVEGPITYDLMAADTIAYLETVVDGPAHLVGWSDGAVVGALSALRRPELVDRLVLVGQWFNPDGVRQGSTLVESLASLRDDPPAFLRRTYDLVSPDGPEHFATVFGKLIDMVTTEPNIPLDELAGVGARTLVLQGDRDEVALGHSAAVAAAIPGARLAVLPGTHMLPIETPVIFNALVIDFLLGRFDDTVLRPPP